jgi:PTH2 family peptidyl-tRNA hydrolase
MIAQGAHASMAWLTSMLRDGGSIKLTSAERKWIDEDFKKIVVGVDTEDELLCVFDAALRAGLRVQIIKDSGWTEFTGPTRTCLAIGPDYESKIDAVTEHLSLL